MYRKFVWTDEALATLRELYPTKTSGDIADVIGCSDACVRDRARILGLKKDKRLQYQYTGRYTHKGRFRFTEDEEKRARIDLLLKRHKLKLVTQYVCERWLFKVTTDDGQDVWSERNMRLRTIRDDLLEFLDKYPTKD